MSFFWVHGLNESKRRTNKSSKNHFAVHKICLSRAPIHSPMNPEKKNTYSLVNSCFNTYRAFMRFFPGVPPHVDHQHILCLERLLFPATLAPSTDEGFLVGLYVVYIDMLKA